MKCSCLHRFFQLFDISLLKYFTFFQVYTVYALQIFFVSVDWSITLAQTYNTVSQQVLGGWKLACSPEDEP